jgi:hypothetical protein
MKGVKLFRRIVGFLIGSLLALATSASAECAWVLWGMTEKTVGSIRHVGEGDWYPMAAFDTRQSCESRELVLRGRGVDSAGMSVRTLCLPDGTDPRGPKGK